MSLQLRAFQTVARNGSVYLRVSAACLPNFFKSRSNVSRSFFERTPAAFPSRRRARRNPRVISARPLACQFNPAHAAVVGVILARNEPFFNQPIDGHANGSGREPDLWADRIHRERALMQENFQDAEIGVAQFCPLDALRPRAGTALERLS